MPATFRTRTTPQVNMLRIQGLAQLTLDSRPIGTPISEGHMVMAFSAALALLDIRIGVGPGEVAPDDALQALREGLKLTRADAQKDLREKAKSA